jgi:RNA-directed DNA polymerase
VLVVIYRTLNLNHKGRIMKRYGNIYDKIWDLDNLRKAHQSARKGKAHYKEVKMVNKNPDYYLKKIQAQLKNKTYQTSQYTKMFINDKGKTREIAKLPYYPDRIVHWAVMLKTEQVFIKHFIYDTYASIPNKGTHKVVNKIKKDILNKKKTKYALKIDIKKFFPNIDKPILKSLLRKKFKDKDLLWLFDEIIDSYDNGMPIGNYISQYLSNYYLSFFDHWVKEELKVKYYYRYMDDIVILSDSKLKLRLLFVQIDDYLKHNLKLKIKNNWQIFPTHIRGIDFLGYRLFGKYTLLRKKIAKRIKKKCKSVNKKGSQKNDLNSLMSYMGWLQHCNSYNFIKKHMVKPIKAVKKYEKIYKQA